MSILSDIWCVISNLDCYLIYGGIAVFNAIIAALGFLLSNIIGAIPLNMPDPPTLPSLVVDGLGWVAWVLPVHTAYTMVELGLVAWIMWQIVALALRWVKATDA